MKDLTLTDAAPASAETGCGCGNCGCGNGVQDSTSDAAGAVVAQYTVAGMTCGHCVKAVTEEVSAIPGVTGVTVDLESGALVITSDAPVDFDRVVEAVGEAGDYTVG
jgi:copper chaperone CopZ